MIGMTIPQLASLALAGVLVVLLIVALIFAQFSSSKFDAGQMFQNDQGKTSGSALWMNIGSAAAVWILVDMEVNDRLDVTFALGVLGMLIAGKLGQVALDRGAFGVRAPPITADEDKKQSNETPSRPTPRPIKEGQ